MALGDFLERRLNVAGDRLSLSVRDVLAANQGEIVEQKLLGIVFGDDLVGRLGIRQPVPVGQAGDARPTEAELVRVRLGIDDRVVANPDFAGHRGP